MNCDMHLTEKLAVYKGEVDRMGIEVMAPCVNRSGATFEVSEGRILYALGALKNVGAEAMRLIVDARRGEEWRETLRHALRFRAPGGPQARGQAPLEMLARSGAFDALDRNRTGCCGRSMRSWPIRRRSTSRRAARRCRSSARRARTCRSRACPAEDWMPAARLAEEHHALGFYFSGHPLDDYMSALKRKGVLSYAEVEATRARAAIS
jgi:DNA polymerase-3 subunit alpha